MAARMSGLIRRNLVNVPDDQNFPLIQIIIVDESLGKINKRSWINQTELCSPAEKPSTGCFVSSANWRRRRRVLEDCDDLDMSNRLDCV